MRHHQHLILLPPSAAAFVRDPATLRSFRERLAAEIEARISLLDAIDGDPEIEEDVGDSPEEENEHGTDLDAGEDGDDNGIADAWGEVEQAHRHRAVAGELPFGWRHSV